jgi:hypothetical protein
MEKKLSTLTTLCSRVIDWLLMEVALLFIGLIISSLTKSDFDHPSVLESPLRQAGRRANNLPTPHRNLATLRALIGAGRMLSMFVSGSSLLYVRNSQQ